MRYKIIFSYDGSKFNGYQKQKGIDNTIQGKIEEALKEINNNKDTKFTSSGRTDKGVSAYKQVGSCDIGVKITPYKLKSALNSRLHDSIHIIDVCEVSDDFHPRYMLKEKTYIYKVNIGEYNPIEKDIVFQYNKKIEKSLIDKYIKLLNGKHNFKSFTSDKEANNYERDLIMDYKVKDNLLILRFESSGFLRYMIRNIVGLLLDINEGKKSLEDIKFIFDSKDRCSLGMCACPTGLYLNKVNY